MADFLTTGERAMLSGDMDSIFDTMSNGRTITIVLEPIKTLVTSSSSENEFGFGGSQKEDIYAYTPSSGTFPAMIIYPMNHPSNLSPEINAMIYAGDITIKVQSNCKDFIQNNTVMKILTDDKTFEIDGEPRRQMFLNSNYYFYQLKATK